MRCIYFNSIILTITGSVPSQTDKYRAIGAIIIVWILFQYFSNSIIDLLSRNLLIQKLTPQNQVMHTYINIVYVCNYLLIVDLATPTLTP